MAFLEPLRRSWSSHSRATRELAIFVAALAFGVLVMPLAIHAIGHETLGEYANGGGGALLADFFRGLASGAKAFWAVALGPYAFILLLRAAVNVARRQRTHEIEA
jgi:hypothetical protein